MKIKYIVPAVLGLLIFAGCASSPETPDIAVRVGMSPSDLKLLFGKPLRVTAIAGGGEDWYYHFTTAQNDPTTETGTSQDPTGRTSYVSASWQLTKDIREELIHVSADGHVIEPLPEGRIVRN